MLRGSRKGLGLHILQCGLLTNASIFHAAALLCAVIPGRESKRGTPWYLADKRIFCHQSTEEKRETKNEVILDKARMTKNMRKIVKKQPLVSVIMPVYNAERYVAAAIDSILHQTYQNFELIIVDDASTDKSAQIVDYYQARYPKKITVTHVAKNINSGGDAAANIALQKAKGTYIARMDADDIGVPTRLEKQVAYLQTHKNIFLVGSSAYVIDKNGKLAGEKVEPTESEAIAKKFFSVHPLIHPSCMYRRKMKNGKPFRYAITFKGNNDYFTFFTLLQTGHIFVNLPEKLLYYRIHMQNATFTNLKQNFINTVRIRMHIIRHFGYHASFKDIVTLIIQSAIVLLMPNRMLTKLYLFARGFQKVNFSLPVLFKSVRPAVSK